MVVLGALEMLDGDRIEPTRSRYAQEVLSRLKAKGHGQVLNRAELLSGDSDVEHFAPDKFRLEPDLLVVVLGGLVYAGDIVLAVTGDKIDSGKLSLLAERSLDELKDFKHVEAPKEIDVAVLRSLFEMLGLPPGLAKQAAQGSDEPVKRLQEEVGKLTQRVLRTTTDMRDRLNFWDQPLLREQEIADRRTRLDALKEFSEKLSPYNTIGKLKNLRVGSDDIAAQKANLEALDSLERLLALTGELGPRAHYLSQAETVLSPDHEWVKHEWVKKAQDTRKQLLENLAADRTAQHAADYRRTLDRLKTEYIAAYTVQHGKARLGVAEDKTKSALQKDPRLVSLRALAGISFLQTSELTSFEEKLDRLRTCAALIDSELAAKPVCPHCHFRPADEQGDMVPAANVLKRLDDELDRLLENWVGMLVELLEDPVIQSNFELLKPASRKLVTGFAESRTLPDMVTPEFIAAVREALSGLEKITVTGEDIAQALFQDGAPATPETLRQRFEGFLNGHCKGKDETRLRFVVAWPNADS